MDFKPKKKNSYQCSLMMMVSKLHMVTKSTLQLLLLKICYLENYERMLQLFT